MKGYSSDFFLISKVAIGFDLVFVFNTITVVLVTLGSLMLSRNADRGAGWQVQQCLGLSS